MFKATQMIKASFEQKAIKHTVVENPKVSYVEAGIKGQNFPSLDVRFFSSDDDNDVSVRVLQICKAAKEKLAKVLIAANQCNNRFRYVKFVVDKDYDVNLEFDMPLRTENVGEVATEILIRIMKIMEEAYPIFMKALYS